MKAAINLILMPLFLSVAGFCLLFSVKRMYNSKAFIVSKVRRILLPFVLSVSCISFPALDVNYPGWKEQSIVRIVLFDIVLGVDNGHLGFADIIYNVYYYFVFF